MPVLDPNYPTMENVAKRLDPDGSVAHIVEVLNKTNDIHLDMPWFEGNLVTGHRTTIRNGIPLPTWRRAYQGVMPSKSTTTQVDENCGNLEALSEIDTLIADLGGNAVAYRKTEDMAIVEGINQTVARTIFYGNEGAEPAQFTGLAPRFNTRNAAVAPSADNVIHGGGASSDNTSVWLVVWGQQSVHGIFPKGSKLGLSMEDMGQQLIQKSDGSKYKAYVSRFQWQCGLSVRDWRYVVRVANISVGALTKDAASGADLVDLLTQATHRVPSLRAGRPAFYANREVMSYLDRQMKNHKNINLTRADLGGEPTLMLGQVPIRRCDELLNTETVVPNS